MNIYLLRHGETDWNREGRLQGRTDIPLNEAGREQVRRAADILAARSPHIELIVASPLARARESAEIAAGRLSMVSGGLAGTEQPPGTDAAQAAGEQASEPCAGAECGPSRTPILTEPLLTERSYGAGEGTTPKERTAKFPDGIYPGMESREELLQRGMRAFRRILEMAEGRQNILAAAHGSILRGMVTAVTAGTPAARQWEIFGNGSIHLIRYDGGQIEVETVYAGTPNAVFQADRNNMY